MLRNKLDGSVNKVEHKFNYISSYSDDLQRGDIDA